MSTISGVGKRESEEVERIKKEIAALQKKLKEARAQPGYSGFKKKEETNARVGKVCGFFFRYPLQSFLFSDFRFFILSDFLSILILS